VTSTEQLIILACCCSVFLMQLALSLVIRRVTRITEECTKCRDAKREQDEVAIKHKVHSGGN
jgi:hypothetical protein